MRKLRDYKAEHARRSVTKDIKTSGGGELSFWRQTNLIALQKLVPRGELNSAIDSGEWPDAAIFQLLEIARVDPKGARDLLKRPQKIGTIYRLLRHEISAVRPRRVSAADRIERAWPQIWDRWLQKFDPSDHQFVRQECARRILEEIA